MTDAEVLVALVSGEFVSRAAIRTAVQRAAEGARAAAAEEAEEE